MFIFKDFDGNVQRFRFLKQACRELGLKYSTVQYRMWKQKHTGKPQVYVWEEGMLKPMDLENR